MNSFPEEMKFCYDWRSYQKRALKDLDNHLSNGKFHLVAPPGSGKTVLGLEVMARINKPTLIVAPTLAIQQQWQDRLIELFLEGQEPEFISMDCRDPRYVTITTYQSLHSLFKEQVGEDEVEEEVDDSGIESETITSVSTAELAIQKIASFGYGTLILDEAHHLRTSWWKTLMELRKRLNDPIVVSLTATPPFDVSAMEWQRYVQLCGHIDMEISVPELVKEKELCPHQDYIHLSIPKGEELKMILHFREAVYRLIDDLYKNADFKELLESHPWITDPLDHVSSILEYPSFFSSMLIVLDHLGSDKCERALPVIGMEGHALPDVSIEWLEILLTGLLFEENNIASESDFLKRLKTNLSRLGAIEQKKVTLLATNKTNKVLTRSVSKLTSIQEIIYAEKQLLQSSLRMVILADYIYLEDLPHKPEEELPLMRLGVVPIFEMLRREHDLQVKLGVLTGSLVILPTSALSFVETISKRYEIAFNWIELTHDPAYVQMELTVQNRKKIVTVMTEVLSAGEVEVLIGTAALLGEGWDAPCINSLIIASSIGSFMQSNQMRGRAIRVDKNNLSKTASIWHLACLDRDLDTFGYDYEKVTRRFLSLVGISETEDIIETGIERLNLQLKSYPLEEVEINNRTTFKKSSKRHELADRWDRAIYNGKEMTEELVAERNSLPRPFFLRHSLKGLLWIAGFTTVGGMVDGIRFLWNLEGVSTGATIYVGLIIGIFIATPSISNVIKLYMRHPSVESSMKEIGETIYLSLLNAKVIHTPFTNGIIEVDAGATGSYTCWLNAGTTHEKNMFMKALQEFLDPIENPRYLIVRKAGKFIKKEDVHAVPQEIGRKKEHAEFLLQEWQKRIGHAELIYTRHFEGRKALLSARLRALSAQFVEKADRISGWR